MNVGSDIHVLLSVNCNNSSFYYQFNVLSIKSQLADISTKILTIVNNIPAKYLNFCIIIVSILACINDISI